MGSCRPISVHCWAGRGDALNESQVLVSSRNIRSGGSKSDKKGAASNGDAAPFLRASAEYKGYVNVEQTQRTKEQFAAFRDDSGVVLEHTTAVLLAGYKLSVVQAENDETYKATAYAAFSGMPDAGLSVSGWAGSWPDALASVTFIVSVQAEMNLATFDVAPVNSRRRTF